MLTTRRKEPFQYSRFAQFLLDNEVNRVLNTNLTRYCTLAHAEDHGTGILSRCFNDLPKPYLPHQPVIDSVVEALENNEVPIWLAYVVGMAVYDLFDRDGAIREEIYTPLNYRHTLDALLQKIKPDEIKVHILSSYMLLPYEYALKEVKVILPGDLNEPEDDNTVKLSMEIKNFLASLAGAAIDRQFIARVNNKLLQAASNPTMNSKTLQKNILDFNFDKIRENRRDALLLEFESLRTRLYESPDLTFFGERSYHSGSSQEKNDFYETASFVKTSG